MDIYSSVVEHACTHETSWGFRPTRGVTYRGVNRPKRVRVFTKYPLKMGTAKPGQLFTKMVPGVSACLGQRETANSMVCFIGHES